ncbi:RNA polymerase sigma-70 factor, ECF subfamily [Zhouia amylolytica]|uniref:RNA polymerase sigma factor n=2 Tax=Zhouia amylolytica TaxID=376730 RepID=W2US72_9FLAO|nr:RNA polymerase sigma factor [Zhouia amylolytica]ETN96843.1 RNA polymerase sigma factor, sigma-70 family [Zhouia amylolytica AD3]MCQ0111190.1 RNA polymerase sigma factor [Zhouia amylolytica]SFS95992.1 RNA polymerase sigma-70 factor, ECF subfamily [Zhouia amylolytica]
MAKRSLLETQIIQLLKDKNEEGMSLLYDNYGETLYGIALKVTKNEELAQDVLQESLIKIWKKIHTYDEDKSKLFTWLFRITRNTAIDKIRSRNLKTDQEIQMDKSNVYKVGIESITPEHLDLKDHLDSLEDKYKIVLEALFFEGMTQQEASDELDIPLGTIKSRLKIGLRELRKIYGPLISVLFYAML